MPIFTATVRSAVQSGRKTPILTPRAPIRYQSGKVSRRAFVKLTSALVAAASLRRSALAAETSTLTLYSVPPLYQTKLSPRFRLTVNAQSVPVLRYIGKSGFIHTAQFALEGAATLTVESSDSIHTWKLGPTASVTAPTLSGKKLTFGVPGPKYLVLQINDEKELLCIIAETPETTAPSITSPTVVDARKANIDNTGKDLVTTQVQALIDRAADIPGGIAYFQPGAYRVGLLELRNNSTIYLAPGAYIMGSASEKDLAITGSQNRGARGEMTSTTVVHANGVHNIRIFGRGIIDGNAWNSDAKSQFRGAINIVGCNNVELDGLTVCNSTMWTAIAFCRDIKINGLKSLQDTQFNETDALDICACVNADIGHCLLVAGDDNFCVKGSGDVNGSGGMASSWGWRGKATPPANITLHDTVFFSGAAALKLGIQAFTEISNVTLRDLQIVQAHRAISITHEQGTASIDRAVFENITVDHIAQIMPNRHISNCPMSIGFGRKTTGSIHDITFRNIAIREFGPAHSDITATGGSIDKLYFENLTIAGTLITTPQAGHFDITGDPKHVTFK